MSRAWILVLGLVLMTAPPVQAAQKANVLVMGLDADASESGSDTVVVARDTRVFNQVLEALAQQLGQNGFDVYDERHLTLDAFKQGRVGRSEAELLDIARSIQKPPIDVAVIFTIYAGARRLTYTTEVYERITARTVNVHTGKRLGSFEVTSPKGWRAAVGCERDCLVETIGRSAAMMAGDLGGTVAHKLSETLPAPSEKVERAVAAPATGYTIVFAGFAPEEIHDAAEYLVAFKGYKQHRAVSGTAYWYDIDNDAEHLSHDLRMMLERIGTKGTISYAAAAKTFSLRKGSPAAP